VQWVQREIQPWHRGDGSVGGIVLISEDVTQSKLAEEEIRQLNASLEQRVHERTVELEVANRGLEAFSYSVSHDLRAPVRRIDGWSLALLEDYGDQLDQRAREYVARIRSETERLQVLIDGMLRLAHVSHAEMVREPVDLSAMVEAICGRLRDAEPERSFEFAVESGLTASGDGRLLEIAATNLLANAAKFTRPRPLARIEFGHRNGSGETTYFIRDNGVGFDMAYAGNLFTAFERLHKDSQFPGSGIGLAIVERVIRRYGGRIWAESQPDEGAAFYFTIGGKQ
jgi:light-regulated signal transduction histidine kinase (bacteriophytochrome)